MNPSLLPVLGRDRVRVARRAIRPNECTHSVYRPVRRPKIKSVRTQNDRPEPADDRLPTFDQLRLTRSDNSRLARSTGIVNVRRFEFKRTTSEDQQNCSRRGGKVVAV